MGTIVATGILLFLGSFAVGTGFMIAKELISRKKAAASDDKTDDKEVDQSSSET